jgi:hypothetical protein
MPAAAAAAPNDACALLSPADIAKATTLKVRDGQQGHRSPVFLAGARGPAMETQR